MAGDEAKAADPKAAEVKYTYPDHEKDDATIAIADVEAFPPGVIFAFGNEKDGLPRAILERARAVVGIPIYGVNHSLPVVVAAGIVMHEWARRHYRGVR